MMKVTILGCGSSCGVPVIGCKCSTCKSESPYNKRRRSSILIESKMTKILVDFGFDIKNQLVDAEVDFLDAAILTHDHADHVSGIDHLRIFKWLNSKVDGNVNSEGLRIITDHGTANKILDKYEYLFKNDLLSIDKIDFYDRKRIKDIEMQFFFQEHSDIGSLEVRVGGLAMFVKFL